MIGTQITIENKTTGKSFIINDYSDPDNIITLQSYPTDKVDVRVNDIQNSGRHGSHKLPYYYGGRTIILNGVIAGLDEATVWAMKKQIDDTMQFASIPSYLETLTLTYTDPSGTSRSIDCTMSVATNYDRRLKEKFKLLFQISLRSNDYYYLSNEVPLEFQGNLGFIYGGFKLKTLVPFKFVTSSSESQIINVSGNYFTKLTLYGSDDGDVINPRFKNIDTGDDILFFYTLSGANEYIEIDGFNGTMKNQNGDDVTVFLVSGDYLTLQDGDNNVEYTSSILGSPVEAIYTIEAREYIV